MKLNLANNNKIKQKFQNSFESWNEVNGFLNEKLKEINSKLNEKQEIELKNQKVVQTFEKELKSFKNVRLVQSRKKGIERKSSSQIQTFSKILCRNFQKNWKNSKNF